MSFCYRNKLQNVMQPIEKSILARIRKARAGRVFSPRQFLNLGGRSAVGVALHRLVRAGEIQRVRRGLYFMPRQHPILGQTGPDIMATVQALMADSHAQWQFTGAYAANALGLSDQVPAKVIILTDGLARIVTLGKLTLAFRHASPRNLLGAGRRAGLVIQALRHLKASSEMATHIPRIRRDLDVGTKRDLVKLMKDLPAWMKPIVKEISQESHG